MCGSDFFRDQALCHGSRLVLIFNVVPKSTLPIARGLGP